MWPGGRARVDESKLDVPKNRLQQTPAFRLAIGEADLCRSVRMAIHLQSRRSVYAAKAPKRHIRRKKLLILTLCDFLTASLKLGRQSSRVDCVESKSDEGDPPGQ